MLYINILATAFGLAACFQSLALCLCPLVFGCIVDKTLNLKGSRFYKLYYKNKNTFLQINIY